jgi:hypothetical protein
MVRQIEIHVWPDEMSSVPTREDVQQEQLYWSSMNRSEGYSAWVEDQVESAWDFATWPLADLVEELKVVQTLTPDQREIIAEIETEIDRRLRS